MRPWSEALGGWLIDHYALSTLLLFAVVAFAGRLRQPARRLMVVRSGLVGLAMIAVLAATPGWPRARWRIETARTPTAIAPEQGTATATPAPLAGRVEAPVQMPPLSSAAEGTAPEDEGTPQSSAVATPAIIGAPDWPDLAGRAFLAGAGLMLAWLGAGGWLTEATRRRSRPAPRSAQEALIRIVSDERAMPELLVSDGIGQPVAVGLLRPAIILPSRFVEEEPPDRLDAAMAHEWAHIRSRDLWWIALSRLLMPVLFAHPLYWWLRRRLRDDQELLADASAADGRIEYAAALLSWARRPPDRPRLAVAGSLALWERPSQLRRRILMLLDRDFRVEPTCPRRWGLGVRGGMAMAVLALSALTFRPAAVEADPPGSPALQPPEKPAMKADEKTKDGATIRVLDPDGKPAAGAAVYRSDSRFHSLDHEPRTAALLTRTGPDGSFRLSPEDAKAALEQQAQFLITAEGCGPAFVDPSAGDGMKKLRLVRDDVPIRGRLIDIQGRPVAGATVQVLGIYWHPSGKLDEWLKALETEKAAYTVEYRMLRSWTTDDVPSLFPAVTTDREGRFTLRGIGRERIASMLINGPGIETRFEYVATRDMPAVKVPDFPRQNQSHQVTYHGARFDLVAGPGIAIEGTVRDKDTGKPLAGVNVQTTAAFGNPLRFLRTATDADGRYRLPGIPPRTSFGDEQDILASLKDGPPYVPTIQHVGGGQKPGPIRMDFSMKRGAWARGRVTDKSNGKPVRANLSYYILEDNPHLKDYPRYDTIRVGMPFHADENGEFKIAVLPGRGVLGARFGNDTYRLGVGIERIKGLKEESPGLIPARPSYLVPKDYNTVVAIDPKPGEESVRADIELDPGRTLRGKLVGPDGEPLAGARMLGAQDHFEIWSHQPLASAEFEVHSLGSGAPRGLLFYHEPKQLAGSYVIGPDESGPITVKLRRCGTVTGRLVDRGGLPMAAAQLTCDRPYFGDDSRFEKGSLPSPITTDKEGRFRVAGLVPGLKYSFRLWKGRMIAGYPIKDVVVKAGEVKDLGDCKAGD